MLTVDEGRNPSGCDFRHQAALHSADLLSIGNQLDINTAPFGLNQCLRDLAMGEAEGLHQNLFFRPLYRPDYQCAGVILRAEGELDGAAGCHGRRGARILRKIVCSGCGTCGQKRQQ